MKKIVINLKKRHDRLANFKAKHQWLEDYDVLEAIDGNTIDHAQMQKNEFGIDHKWRDPFKNRRITKGEVGCFLSHYKHGNRLYSMVSLVSYLKMMQSLIKVYGKKMIGANG